MDATAQGRKKKSICLMGGGVSDLQGDRSGDLFHSSVGILNTELYIGGRERRGERGEER